MSKNYDLYLMSVFDINTCQNQKNPKNSIFLNNENTAYFYIKNKIVMKGDKPLEVLSINRGNIPKSDSKEPTLCTVLGSEIIIREALTEKAIQDNEDVDDREKKLEEKIKHELNKEIHYLKFKNKNLQDKLFTANAVHMNYVIETQAQLKRSYQSNIKAASTMTPFYHYCLDKEVQALIKNYNQMVNQPQLHVVAHVEKEEKDHTLKLSFFIVGLSETEIYNITETPRSYDSLLTDYKEAKVSDDQSEAVQEMINYLTFEFSLFDKFKEFEEKEVKKNQHLRLFQFISHCKNHIQGNESEVIKNLHVVLERFFKEILLMGNEIMKKHLPNFKIGRTTTSESQKHASLNCGHSVVFKYFKNRPDLQSYERLVANRHKQDFLCHIVLLGNGAIDNFQIIALLSGERFGLPISKIDSIINQLNEEKLITAYRMEISSFFKSQEVIDELIRFLQKNQLTFPAEVIKDFMIICRAVDFVHTEFKLMSDIKQYEVERQELDEHRLMQKLGSADNFLMQNINKVSIYPYFQTDAYTGQLEEILQQLQWFHREGGRDHFFKEPAVKAFLSNMVLLAGILNRIVKAGEGYQQNSFFQFWYKWILSEHIVQFVTLGSVAEQNALIIKIGLFKDSLKNYLSPMINLSKKGVADLDEFINMTYNERYGFHVK